MGKPKRTKEQIKSDIETQTKQCCVCEERKSFDDFFNFKNKSDNKSYRCKPCDAVAKDKWRENNPEKAARSSRNIQLKNKYGITLEMYESKLKEQYGCCAICFSNVPATSGNQSQSFAVDHNHETGQVRGLLCNKCNRGLGLFNDDINTLQSAMNYLTQYEESE